MTTARGQIQEALAVRAGMLEHLLERHPAFDLLACCETVLEEGTLLLDDARDLLRRMEHAILALEDETVA